MQFKNLNDLQKVLPSMLQKSLVATDDVRKVVARAVSEAVESEVYDEYEPEVYQRRGLNGGLADPDNVEVVGMGNFGGAVKMIFENTTEGADSMSGKKIASGIINGDKSMWDNPNGAWSEPRDFISVASDNLKGSSELKVAVVTSLNKAGFETR